MYLSWNLANGYFLYKINTLVIYVNYTLLQEKFEEAFGKAGVPAVNLTRWNSILRQVKSILDKGLVQLNSVCREVGHNECVFTQKEWDQLTELSEILHPFKVYTDLLQGEEVQIKCNFNTYCKMLGLTLAYSMLGFG